MFCKKCGKEINDKSIYCNFCGEKQNGANNIKKAKKTIKLYNKKGLIFGGVVFSLIITAVIFMQLLSNPVNKFLNSVEENKYLEAISIYDEKLKGDLDKENEITKKLKNQIQEISNRFKNNSEDYDASILALKTIKKTKLLDNEVNIELKKIEEIQLSRVAYKKGIEFKNSKNYADAVQEFNKVIKLDKNYSIAQQKIKEIIDEYKADIISRSKENANMEDYKGALKLISSALKVIPNDTDLLAKEASYKKLNNEKEKEEQRLKMEKLKNNQEVEVISTREYYDSINTNFIAVKVKNNNVKKRVKSYSIGFMGFDDNGLPVKVGLGAREFVGRGRADQNILPNKIIDSGGGWYLDNHDVKTLIACIDEVEYYENGEKWKNPYYEMWVEEYQEKPLH